MKSPVPSPKIIRNILLLVVSVYLLIAARNQSAPVRKGALTTPAAVETVASASAQLYPVSRIVDGDTIDVDMNGTVTRIRLVGVDTPELLDPRKPVECFAREASAYLSSLLTGTSVRLEPDPTQDDKDKYDRLLRYVYLPDGSLVNRMLIAGGYAHEYTYDRPYRFMDIFKESENEARTANRGLWNRSACP